MAAVENIETIINPVFKPLSNETDLLWEACFSATQDDDNQPKIAKVERYTKILASYYDLEAKKQQRLLENFSARIFQHEYDHLLGIVNVYKADAKIKEFTNRDEMKNFFQQFKIANPGKIQYVQPKIV